MLFNDTDLFGGTVTAFDATSAQGGTVNVAVDGSFTYDPPTGFISPPDDTFTYTVTNGAGSAVGTVTITVIPPPEANNDTYSAHGNLSIVIPDGANDLLANDVLNGAVISAYDPVSAQGGIVSVNANGSFVYVPPPGFEGADTFTYTLDNALTDTATVTINVSGMIWFIDSSAPPGGLGTFNLPFNSLNAFNTVNNGTGNNPAAGDRIFIYQRGTTYAGGITLLNNQQLIGQGEDLSALVGALPLGSPILPGATSNPSITNNSGPVISLNNGNDIRGLNTTGPAGDAITGNNTIGGSFQNITISGATSSGIFLNGTPSGTFTFASNVTIDATTTGVAFFVNGGNANITFSGSITKTDTNTLVYIANTTGGTITFQTGTLSTTNGDGIYLENVDGTVNFNGTTTLNGGNARVRILAGSSGSFTFGTGTNITNPTGTPFSVNASSPTVTYSGSMSKSSAGLLVDLTTVSSGTITFQTGTLSATDGDGILLDNADGTVNFNGITTLNGGNARIRIQNGSAGTVNFANATITNPTGTAFTINASSPSGAYTGSISKNNAGLLVDLTNVSGGTYTFAAGGTVSATSGDGLLFFNADGTVNFSGTTTLNGGSARVRIESGSSGTFNFSNGTITNPTTGVSFLISSSSPSGTFTGNISASGNYVFEATGMTGGSYTFNSGTLTATGSSLGARIANSAGNISVAALTVGSSGSPLSIDGLTLTNNTGTYTFTALNIHTTGAGNNAILGITAGTVNTSSGTIASSSAAAIDINGATLGMTLTSVSANGGANGISLQNTTGSFTIAGGGDTSLGGNSSGGTIQNSTGAGINLNNVASPSFTNVTIQNTQGSGITGSQVSNFTFRNGTITNSGLSAAAFTSNINFNDNAANTSISMLTGTVNISGNILSNAFYSGVDIQNYTGAVSDLTVSGNQITSSTSTATSVAPGIRILAYSGADVTRATISNNTVTNFPSDAGIMVVGGNATEGGNSSDFGVPGSATDIIAITGNTISGQSAANRIGTQGILVSVNGSGTGNFNISNNSVSHTVGNSISLNVFGDAVVVSTINNNTIVSNNTFGARGIAGGVGVATGFATNTPSLTATVEGNNISQTDGNGIFFVANENVVSNADWEITLKINNNIVAAPLTGFRSGIQVNAGGATGDNDIRLEINGNTSDGSVSTTVEGIGLRKQGTDPNLNAFAIEGLSPSPNTLGSQVINHVNSLNPAGGGTLLVSAETGFTAAVVPLLAEGGENAGSFNGAALMPAHLAGIAEAAAARWAATGLSAAQIARLAAINVTTAELPDGVLAYAYPDRIEIDASAAGYGWFVDPSPDDDSEFSRIAAPTEYRAAAASPAFGQMDLLTAIMHEYGHILGLDDAPSAANPHALMVETLPTGTRRFPLAHMAGDKPDPGVLRLALIPALSGETVSTSIHTLPAGDTVRIIFDVTVDNPLPAGVTQVCNQGTISGLLSGVPFSEVTDDPNTAAADDPTCTPVSAAPIMDATKTASDLNGGSAVPGDEIEYTITISNSGNQDAGSVTLNDPIPANTTYVAGSTTLNSSSAADAGGAMPYASGGLVNSPGAAAGVVEAGQSAVIVFRVTVNDPFPAGVNTISNQGTISGVGFTPFLTDDPGVGGADDPTVTTIIAGLTFSKDFLTDPILTGETSTLQFTITNPAGNPALTNLSFTDDLPSGLVYVSPVTTPQCDGTVTLIDADSLTFTGGSLGAGDSACTIEVTVESNGAALGSLTNTTSPLTADGGITAAPATAVIFIGVPPTATPPGDSNGVFNFPTPPATPLCVDENFNPNSVIRASIPDRLRTSVFCRLLVQNGEYVSYLGYFITNPAQIGLQSVLDSSVFQAVDVFSPNGPQSYPEGALICLRGTGTLLFLSASEAPRSARPVEGFAVDDFAGYTCVILYEPGTLVLIPSSTGVQPAAAPPAAAGITELTNCMITTQYIARLRAEPNTSSAILDQVPYQLMLQATAYTNGWYRVIFGSQQGWISETLLTTTGNCG
ncbi:Ig-like domain-containing protein [Geitlerinema calcuttense]|uniref:Ig-like domain-containing protein n=1 Tax=Geitlerinema calcuttense NRMC-F 0142 TaxID=2922238 RepID=A0ABT7LW10_9CYAN|nr:Ig-like domain-containing protein [Geitlerinema calcuttense]MDL5056227.1 Ig-like domain-containing protein [Geitlerinema calcuttense NRMC-F 0142]